MKFHVVSVALATVSVVAISVPAFAADGEAPRYQTAWEASRSHDDDGMIATGVAKARDRLDSATSTSSLDDHEIVKLSPISLADLLRNVPGIRAEAASGEGNNANYTIRGLPLVSTGAKYLQFQEDGLPVLEFGDILGVAPDVFLRPDFNIAQIESIRGGSASTFASNAPGGVINLISQTGEVEGGSVQASVGLNYRSIRTDFDYGGHLSDTLRFHVGGFYRDGNGPRRLGFTADRGGQVKLNVTKEFGGGYIRLYGKYLDDRNVSYLAGPVAVAGTNDDPKYSDVANFSINRNSLVSSNLTAFPRLDENNALTSFDARDGQKVRAISVGFDAKVDLAGWTIMERMRYSDQSGRTALIYPFALVPAAFAATAFGAPGGMLTYATGPLAGQTIGNPAALNENGLLVYSGAIDIKLDSLNNFTNDLRASRVWDLGSGSLTTTAGFYAARQDIKFSRGIIDVLQDVNGSSALINVVNANGSPRSQGGALDFSGPNVGSQSFYDLEYTVLAPYGSLNYHQGKVSVGASIRVDTGRAEGFTRANGPANVRTIDVNGDGIISDAERTFVFAPAANNTPVDYRYNYVSYSGSVNYRPAESFSLFARYSRGARAGADRILFSPAISSTDGSLLRKKAAYDPVRQAEIGIKFREGGLFLNVTGFWAKVTETNTQLRPGSDGSTSLTLVSRSYRAFGGEFEGGLRQGPFSVTATATFTNAKITAADDPAVVGNKPRHQAPVIYQLTSQYDTDLFTVGANLIGTARSYAQDENLLRMPGYTTVNAFLQVRPVERVVLSLNAGNIFNTKAFTDVAAASLPASGVVLAQTLMGRTISTAVRFYF